jgi:NAD/NADP octopine/nopaline dehydrogenase, alpha-helical domain
VSTLFGHPLFAACSSFALAMSLRPKVCVVGGGNAAHALAALLPFKGYETTMYCPFQDEANRIKAGMKDQGGYLLANFASHNNPSGEVKGTPSAISKEAADVVPGADLILMPLPSFAYPTILNGLKDHLREGQTICVTPGQGAFDWFARDILGEELMSKITIMGLMPMPFNCRIEEFGKIVNVQELKKKYCIGVIPIEALPKCLKLVEDMFGHAEPAGSGSFLECTLYPINAIIHPARLFTLLKSWKTGTILAENPLFYEDMTPEATNMMDELNKELIAIGKGIQEQGVDAEIPHIFDFLARYVYGEPEDSSLCDFFRTNDAYKGFRCPLVPVEGGGYLPDFANRYFTEDINLGLCGYKGMADIGGVETPVIDSIIEWAQSHMKMELIVDGHLNGKDVCMTSAPQRFGMKTIADLQAFYNKLG